MVDRQLLLVVVTAAGIVSGFAFPGVGKFVVPALAPSLMAMIFIASLKMRAADLLADMRRPKALLAGVILILLVIPLLGWLLPVLYPLAPMTYVGLLLYLASPAPASSAFFAEVMRGRPTLSLNISGLSTLLCIITIPAVMLLMAGTVVQVDVLRIVQTLIQIIILPFVAAMAMVRYTPHAASAISRYSFVLSMAILYLIYLAFVGAGYEEVVNNISVFMADMVIMLGVIAASFAVGHGIARLIRTDAPESMSIALGAGVKNGSIGLFVALAAFGPAMIPPIIAGGLLSIIMMVLFGKLVNRTSPSAR